MFGIELEVKVHLDEFFISELIYVVPFYKNRDNLKLWLNPA